MSATPEELRRSLWTFLDQLASIPADARPAALRGLGIELTPYEEAMLVNLARAWESRER